ncbi:putative ethylene-responsive transcription factor CRF4-like [Capsicum annuum]|nr:putative ethylene-responsive transcription factor CRF4-like [Capsicum annuum]
MDKLRNLATKGIKFFCPESSSGSKKQITSGKGTSSSRYTHVPSSPVPFGTPFEEEIGVGAHDMDYVEAQENYGIEEENEVDTVNLDEDDENIGETPAVENANVRSESINLPPRAPKARKTTSIAWQLFERISDTEISLADLVHFKRVHTMSFGYFLSKRCSVLQPLTVSSSMADQENPLTTMKKTLFYKFYPSGDEEEACKAKNVPWLVRRELIEIRDTYPVPIIDLENPWKFKKKIDEYDFTQTGLLIPFLVAFEHIIRYWKLPDGKTLVNGNWWTVVLCDVTEENDLKKYDGASGRSFRFGKMWDDDYFLQCRQLFIDRGLGVGDEIGLYWDPWSSMFMFKLLSKFGDSRIRTKH